MRRRRRSLQGTMLRTESIISTAKMIRVMRGCARASYNIIRSALWISIMLLRTGQSTGCARFRIFGTAGSSSARSAICIQMIFSVLNTMPSAINIGDIIGASTFPASLRPNTLCAVYARTLRIRMKCRWEYFLKAAWRVRWCCITSVSAMTARLACGCCHSSRGRASQGRRCLD